MMTIHFQWKNMMILWDYDLPYLHRTRMVRKWQRQNGKLMGVVKLAAPIKMEKWNPIEIVGKYVNNFPDFFSDYSIYL